MRPEPGTHEPRSSTKRGLVLVTGGSGYVAGYCVAELLNNGWSVRTTVRSGAKAKAVRASIGAIASNASEIEIVTPISTRTQAGTQRAAGGKPPLGAEAFQPGQTVAVSEGQARSCAVTVITQTTPSASRSARDNA